MTDTTSSSQGRAVIILFILFLCLSVVANWSVSRDKHVWKLLFHTDFTLPELHKQYSYTGGTTRLYKLAEIFCDSFIKLTSSQTALLTSSAK